MLLSVRLINAKILLSDANNSFLDDFFSSNISQFMTESLLQVGSHRYSIRRTFKVCHALTDLAENCKL